MKKHLCSISYDLPGWIPSGLNGFEWVGLPKYYQFTGYIYGTTVDPVKLFKIVFGFELPAHSTITIG